jgi:hypothetical protein
LPYSASWLYSKLLQVACLGYLRSVTRFDHFPSQRSIPLQSPSRTEKTLDFHAKIISIRAAKEQRVLAIVGYFLMDQQIAENAR